MTSDTVALICRNLADTIERDTDLLQVMLLTAEQQVIAAARSENLTMIRDAISNLNDAQDAVDNARRGKAIRRLSEPTRNE